MDFIPCEHRADTTCNHAKVHVSTVTPAWCAACKWRLLPSGPKAPIVAMPRPRVAVLKPSTDCIHRGDVVRTVGCETCSGSVQLKVFSCDVHEVCSLSPKAGVKVCQGCAERKTG